ncbi:hypothetical protein TNIN_69671 [Trichonephila inaurata madagascariensis]|uniref:Uncharacterized protein n=1 Tax=Trichonephila inaurata madagascariensis TaxID=2747483 RepID=A0A8X6XZB1_9ARAC|nr:hypothetical protein TNIN_69671 [Trichonephila inaurata madagascariensis]
MRVEKNSVVIWKEGKPLTIIVDHVQIYQSRDRGEGDVETDKSSDAGSEKAEGESEVREGQAREENTKEEQSQGKRKRRSSGSSPTLQNELQHLELARREKRLPQEKRSLLK